MKTVTVESFESMVKERIPGAYLHRSPSSNYPYLLNMGVHVDIGVNWANLPADGDYAEKYIAELIEQLQLHAIHELGLEPRLRAYEREVGQFRTANELLAQQLKRANEKIGLLMAEIDELKEEKGEED